MRLNVNIVHINVKMEWTMYNIQKEILLGGDEWIIKATTNVFKVKIKQVEENGVENDYIWGQDNGKGTYVEDCDNEIVLFYFPKVHFQYIKYDIDEEGQKIGEDAGDELYVENQDAIKTIQNRITVWLNLTLVILRQ